MRTSEAIRLPLEVYKACRNAVEKHHFQRHRLTFASTVHIRNLYYFDMSYAPVAIGSEPVACTTSINLPLSEAWVQELDELIPETTAPVAELETTYTDNRAEISRVKWAMIRTYAFFMYYVIMIRVSS